MIVETQSPSECGREAFGRLVEKFQSPVRRYLFHLTGGNAALADDLAQDSFVKAYTRLETCRGNYKAWLFRIAYYTYIDYFRTKKTRVASDILETAYAAATHLGILNETLSCLTEQERHLAILSYIEDLSHTDIAEVTGIPLGSVKTILRRTKSKLKNHLHHEE